VWWRDRLTLPFLIISVWLAGGLVALVAAFIWAELAWRRPEVGGQYSYLREAFHPSVAFMYGWALLLVIQTGGMAAVAITFALYFLQLTGLQVSDSVVAAVALGSVDSDQLHRCPFWKTVQSILMVLKILAILGLIACWTFSGSPTHRPGKIASLSGRPMDFRLFDGDRRCNGTCVIRLWRMANSNLRRR